MVTISGGTKGQAKGHSALYAYMAISTIPHRRLAGTREMVGTATDRH
jgi:hypothetical protein